MRRVCLILLAVMLLGVAAGSRAAERQIRTDFRVENLSCSSCLLRIRWELKKLDGVIDMYGNLSQKIVRVDHTSSLPAEVIASTLTELGYPATILAPGTLTGDEGRSGREGVNEHTCGLAGCQRTTPCNATAKAWRQLFSRWFGDGNTKKGMQPEQ